MAPHPVVRAMRPIAKSRMASSLVFLADLFLLASALLGARSANHDSLTPGNHVSIRDSADIDVSVEPSERVLSKGTPLPGKGCNATNILLESEDSVHEQQGANSAQRSTDAVSSQSRRFVRRLLNTPAQTTANAVSPASRDSTEISRSSPTPVQNTGQTTADAWNHFSPSVHRENETMEGSRSKGSQDQNFLNQIVLTQRQFHQFKSFLFYSAYRQSAVDIILIGAGPEREFRKPTEVGTCSLVQDDGHVIHGILNDSVTWEKHGCQLELHFLTCHLILNETDGLQDDFTAPTGSHLEVEYEGERYIAYQEEAGHMAHAPAFEGPFEHKVAFCSQPMRGLWHLQGIVQFIVYHQYNAGFEHFHLYNAGLKNTDFEATIEPLVKQGVITTTDFQDIEKFDFWQHGQTIAMNDCLYRNRETAQWVAFHDFDEYLDVKPPHTVLSVLDKHKDSTAAVTHGAFVYRVGLWELDQLWNNTEFAVELLHFKEETPYCIKPQSDPSVCIWGEGYRKVIANPRRLKKIVTHAPFDPPFPPEVVNLPTSILRHGHFRCLNVPAAQCYQRLASGPLTASVDCGARDDGAPEKSPMNASIYTDMDAEGQSWQEKVHVMSGKVTVDSRDRTTLKDKNVTYMYDDNIATKARLSRLCHQNNREPGSSCKSWLQTSKQQPSEVRED